MVLVSAGASKAYLARSQYINAALLSEAFVLVSPIKQSVSGYYLSNGAMPQSNKDAGLATPKSIFGTSVKRIAINPGGVLQVDFDEEIGKVAMNFTPVTAKRDGFLSWRCSSDSIERAVLEKLRPTCSYQPPSKDRQQTAAIERNQSETVASRLSQGSSMLNIDQRDKSVLAHTAIPDAGLSGEEQRSLYVELRSAASECNTARLDRLLSDDIELPKNKVKLRCSDVLTEYVENLSVYKRAMGARLADAMRQCNSKEVRTLLRDNPGVDVLNQDSEGGSLFEQAVIAGCTVLVSTLIRENKLAGTFNGQLLQKAIMQAPQDKLVNLVGSLIDSGADVNALSSSGDTALSAAITAGQPVVANYLIDAGADVNVKTPSGSYPLIEATKKGHTQLVSRLLAADAEINSVDSFGRSAIIAAVVQHKTGLVELLLQSGANPYLGDKDGINALVLARNSDQRVIQSLIASHASTI